MHPLLVLQDLLKSIDRYCYGSMINMPQSEVQSEVYEHIFNVKGVTGGKLDNKLEMRWQF